MAKENWITAFTSVLVHEGGWADHPNDPGGATMRGVTLATYRRYNPGATKNDLRNITDGELQTIYRDGYWNVVKGDDLPSGVDYAVYDFAVNSGPRRAAEFLQRIVRVSVDGKIGPMTIAAVNSMDASTIITQLCDNRLVWLKTLSTWSTFGKGWERRVNEVKSKALSMVKAKPAPSPIPRPTPTPSQPSGANPYLVAALLVAAAIAYFILKSIGVVP